MPCKDCGGYWQCSDDDDPCSMANTPIEEETKCLQILTKKPGSGCKMDIKLTNKGDPAPGGWTKAGEICFKFSLFEDAESGKCFVKVENA